MSKPIYYLISAFEDAEYIMAISFDREILENMIKEKDCKEKDFKFIIKENLKIHQIVIYNDDVKTPNYKYEIMHINYLNKKLHCEDLYAFNKIKKANNGFDYIIEDGIIDLYSFNDKINEIPVLKNNISANLIKFDTYYEEGVMNA